MTAPPPPPPPMPAIAIANDCKNGGWQKYDRFKNEGDCVSWVADEGQEHAARGIRAGLIAPTLASCSGEALFYRTDGTYTADVATEALTTARKTLRSASRGPRRRRAL